MNVRTEKYQLIGDITRILKPHVKEYLDFEKHDILQRQPVVTVTDMNEFLYGRLGLLTTMLKQGLWNDYQSSCQKVRK